MLTAWRVSKTRYRPFDGTGARLSGGRWNSPGRDVVYASDSYAGALLEILAHAARPRTLPGPHHAVRIEIPEDLVEHLDETTLRGWESPGSAAARGWGDRWLAEGRSAAVSLPSLPARPVGRTIAIDPRHPDAARIVVSDPFPVPWDERLF
jgi:RES domain-containing protein